MEPHPSSRTSLFALALLAIGAATAHADPWSEVGPDGQPRSRKDSAPLKTSSGQKCDAAHDHCLRPWVWFTEDGEKTLAAMVKDGKLYRLVDIDELYPLETSNIAYRTVPATQETLKIGQRVYYTEYESNTEHHAMTRPDWHWGLVSDLHGGTGMIRIAKGNRLVQIHLARIAVVQWFPGEKAEKAEP